jgi:hypothetical protein
MKTDSGIWLWAVIVGETNPYGIEPEFAMYPLPENSAGGRMQRLVLGIPRSDYIKIPRYNLCEGKWSIKTARKKALVILNNHPSCRFILCGKKVCDGFSLDFTPYKTLDDFSRNGDFAIIPHPSGLNRMWGEPDAFMRARDVIYRGVLV